MQASTEITSKAKYGVEYGFENSIGAQSVSFEPVVAEQMACSFFLLGPFAIADTQGNVITPKTQKTCAMLAMLILSPRATRTRVWIRDKLWSDRSEEQAGASLRQALLDARRSLGHLGSEIILADKKSISLDLSKINVDTESLMMSALESAGGRGALERALNEDLLEGMDIRDPEFEDWLTLERQVWQRRIAKQLEQEASVLATTNSASSQRYGFGQKVMTTTVVVRLGDDQREANTSEFDESVSVIRDGAVDSGGRVFDVRKHHVLMEFARPTDAVRLAIGLIIRLGDASRGWQSEDRLNIGIGINSGLVYREKSRLYGTECDIAFEASNISERGAVMITEASAALVQGKVDYQFVFDKECSVENFPKPIRLFSVTQPTLAEEMVSNSLKQSIDMGLSDNGPSIGVLPFRVSDGSVHEYMGEGLADDIIVALSNNHWLNVISRNSSFSYQYDQGGAKAIANDLSVSYIVGGSVKVLDSIISIVVTLESVTSNRIIWSELFSVDISEIMHLQERIATKITAHLLQELGKHEQVRAYESGIDDLTTWQLVHRGHWHMARRTSTGVERARKLYERALDRDEFQSDALVALAWWHFWKAWSEHGKKQTSEDLDEASRLCRKALLMDRSDGRVHAYLGAISIMRNQASNAIGLFDESIRLNPSLSFAYSSRGSANLLLGRPELAHADIRTALTLNPADYYRFHSFAELASAYYFSSELELSIEAAESSTFLAPRYWYARLIKIVCLITRNAPGDIEQAVHEKAEIVNHNLNVSDENIRAIPFINREYNERLISVYKEV